MPGTRPVQDFGANRHELQVVVVKRELEHPEQEQDPAKTASATAHTISRRRGGSTTIICRSAGLW